MNLILIESPELRGDRVHLSDARAEHITAVLKARLGDEIRVGLLNGNRGRAAVIAIEKGAVELDCRFDEPAPPPPRVDLLLALPRPKVMRRLWAQLAAMGVGRIILTNAWKVEKMYFDSHVLRPEGYRPPLIEGLQQAGDTRLPDVHVFKQFKILIEDELDGLFPDGLRLLARPGEGSSVLDAVPAARSGRVLLAVGPEGGWIPYEEELLTAHGFLPVSMGTRPLRTDTACLALLALAHAKQRREAGYHSL
ncbi:MAG TPA: RsmE family RNA methyltransferase [Kiritimatiellia bacterium]|nr:RsmE family RNA methyltransferase [Kiritimatiellia bacterium]HRZ12546.1 RsmE family RNA methyltransferase [Kiritimatiellia bacterium]HSA17624.1 RsmE family RNA methyltransferase [Kiritimatiellia bacterium]